ncbi:MAG TPA: hypothetical protein VM580_06585 [Labilithrix sp.]|nr:hypothetical protein [Labilithrix sp.]
MRSIVVSAVVFAAVATLVGCSSEDDDSNSSASTAASTPESFCQSFCTRYSECDSSSDVQTCSETCAETVSLTTKKMRPDVVEELLSCWNGSDCRQVLGEGRFRECLDEAAVGAAPTATTKSFCDALGASLDKCDSKLDRAQCLESAKVYSDARLEQAKKCTTKSCGSIMDCVDATL